jgi:hypothetical protein
MVMAPILRLILLKALFAKESGMVPYKAPLKAANENSPERK